MVSKRLHYGKEQLGQLNPQGPAQILKNCKVTDNYCTAHHIGIVTYSKLNLAESYIQMLMCSACYSLE